MDIQNKCVTTLRPKTAANIGFCNSWAGRSYNRQQYTSQLLFGQDKQHWALVHNIISISLLSISSGQTVGQFPTIAKPCSLQASAFLISVCFQLMALHLLNFGWLLFRVSFFAACRFYAAISLSHNLRGTQDSF